jgi:nuclear pore complex protein Nup54
MSAPTQFKGKLNELLSQVRLQSQTAALSGGCSGGGGGGGGEKYQLDGFLLQDVKEVLKLQQNGIQALIQVIKEDLVDLGTVNEAMSAVVTKTTKPF